jgi:hypothetical protein
VVKKGWPGHDFSFFISIDYFFAPSLSKHNMNIYNKYLGHFNNEEIVAAFESEHIKGVLNYVLYTAPRPDAQSRACVAPHAMVDMYTAQFQDAEAWLDSGANRAAIALETFVRRTMGTEYVQVMEGIAEYAKSFSLAASNREVIGTEDFGSYADPMYAINASTFYNYLEAYIYLAMYLVHMGVDPAKPQVPVELAHHGNTLSDPIEV